MADSATNKEAVRASLFGPNPVQDVSEAREASIRSRGMEWASVPAGRGAVAAAGMAGEYLGRGIGGATGIYQDPAEQRARALQEAQQEVDSSGADLLADPMGYYAKAYESMKKRGLEQEAMQVYQIMQEQKAAQAAGALEERKVGASEMKAEASMLNALRESNTGDSSKNVDVLTGPEGDMKQAQKGSPEYQELLDAGYRIAEKPNDINTLAKAVVTGNQTLADAMVRAQGAEAEAEARGKANVAAEEDIYARATLSRNILSQLNTVEAAIQDGETQFGSLADTRRAVAGAFETFMPGASEAVNELLGVNLVSYDAVERSSKTVLAEMAKYYSGGGRMTQAALQTLETAGPSVFLTNAGLTSVIEIMRKSAAWDRDKGVFIANLPPNTNIRAAVNNWEEEHMSDPKYNMSSADFKRLRDLEKKNTKLKAIMDKAQPMPMAKNRETGTWGPSGSQLSRSSPGSIYSFEGKFYKWDGKSLTEVDL